MRKGIRQEQEAEIIGHERQGNREDRKDRNTQYQHAKADSYNSQALSARKPSK
jgi:hypothetical protein